MTRALKQGDQFNDESSPLEPLTIGRVVRTEGDDTVHEVHKGNMLWNILSMKEIYQRALPPVLPGDVIVLPAAIPACSMIVYVGNNYSAVFSSVYLSADAGVELRVKHFYSQIPSTQIAKDVWDLASEAANVYHRGLFKGQIKAENYVKRQPYVYLR